MSSHLWIATIDWGFKSETGMSDEGYTVLMPTRKLAECRVFDTLKQVAKADPRTATVISYTRTKTATRASVELSGQRFDFRVIAHQGNLKTPGYQVKEGVEQ